jgi:hypothetical protein
MDLLIALIIFGLCVYGYLLVGLWMYQDAAQRGANAVGWLIAWFVGNLVALLVWNLVRPPDRQPPEAGRRELV